MKLSVIIVNYNVKHFIEQCLISVQKALSKVEGEVIVVDNHSLDGSVEMMQEKFPKIQLIASDKNLGFSKGNNLGIEQAKGEYILLLNPDTLVEEDTFEKVIQFMDNHNDAGGLGVKMMDGKGFFLPESKRGLPTPEVAFYKMFGLAKLFPNSRRFGRYHLTYLDADKTHEVDVLSGAFMLLRKTVLDKIGLLDETFFMYGEDIDLSYRIQLGGYNNYYFPGTQIIHYKGESTKKSSVNYVFVFYRAMVIFAKKHFSTKNAQLFGILINLAIYFRASITLFTNFFRKGFLAILDFTAILIALFGLVLAHNSYTGIETPTELYQLLLPIYSFTWVTSLFFSGAYDRPVLIKNYLLGTLAGTAILLILYSLLPESYRFSRIIILLGTLSTVLLGIVIRYLLHWSKIGGFKLGNITKRRFAIVGSEDEIRRVIDLLKQTIIQPDFIAKVLPSPAKNIPEGFVGNMRQLREISKIFRIEEIIFCAENVSSANIIEQMSQLDNKTLDFKIAPPESLFVIGSNSINTSGELYSVLNINSITKAKNLRIKRVLDLTLTLLFIGLFPVLLLFVKNKGSYIKNIFEVLFGQKSWIGYDKKGNNLHDLPIIKNGVLSCSESLNNVSESNAARMNIMYAKDYQIFNDLVVVAKNLTKLGK